MKKNTRWRASLSIAVVAALLALGAGVFLVTTNSAKAELKDLPPLTMKYSETVKVGNQTINQVRELVYHARDSWTETVIETDTIEAWGGTDSDLGSYQKVQGDQYTVYDASSGETITRTVEEGYARPPKVAIQAMPPAEVEDQFGIKAVPVSTSSKVCFDGDCTENASALKLDIDGWIIVVADDSRGIPLKAGNFEVTEVRVHSTRSPVESSRD